MARSRRTSSVAAVALAGMAGVPLEADENVDNVNMIENAADNFNSGKQDLPQGDLLDRWVATFKEDQKTAVGTIITMILQAAGVNEPLPQDYFKRKAIEPSHVIGELVQRLGGRGDPDYPVADKRGAKPARKSFSIFFKELGRMVAADTATLNLSTCKSTFMSWILTMSSVAYRPIRVAATLAGLSLFEGIAQGLHDLSKQVDRLNKMKRRKDSEGATVRISAAENLITWWTEGLLIQRYRDVDSGIRMDVLKTLAECITTLHPDLFLDNAYLRYMGWSLSDKEERLRVAALNYLKHLYASPNRTALTAFTDRFKTRILEMAVKDVDQQVRERACELLEKMHSSGLLITEDCVEAVREMIVERRDQNTITKLTTVVNHVVFGQPSAELSCDRIINAIHTFTQGDMQQARVIIKVVTVNEDQFLSFTKQPNDTLNLAIYVEMATMHAITLPTDTLLNLVAGIESEDDRMAIFQYTLTSAVECSEALLEAVMNELVQCRQEATGVAGLKCLLTWRKNDEVMRVRVEQWIQTAINNCLEQVKTALCDIDGKRKIDHDQAPFLPLSLLSTVRRCPVDNVEFVSVMDKLEGLSLLSQQQQRGGRQKKVSNGQSLGAIYHRLLLLLYNDFLWMQSDAKLVSAEDRIDRLCALKQSACLSRPIMQGGEYCSQLRKAAIAILTDCALISKTKDDVEDIIGALLTVTVDGQGDSDEWKAVIAGRLFMAGLIEDQIAIPLLIAFRKSKVGGEICRAAVERSKTLPAGHLVAIMSTLLPDMEGLKYAITHYKPVIKGTGQSAVMEAAMQLHDSIVSNTENDNAGALLGFVFEEVGDVSAFSAPPASFKQYRRLFDRLSRTRPVTAAPMQQPDTPAPTSDPYPDDAFDLTSPGMDADAPSLPNSPLDKIIRLE